MEKIKKRHILSITGSRADYGLARTIFKAIDSHPKLRLSLIVTGMHLLEEYGMTVREIEKDNFDIVGRIKVDFDSTPVMQSEATGTQIIEISKIIEKEKPDMILVLCDLGHSLAGALAGLYSNLPVIHYEGGDESGTIDDFVRNAITKLSHIHLVISKRSADKILGMDEDKKRVYVTGASQLDDIIKKKWDEKELASKYKLKGRFLLVTQHPVSLEKDESYNQMVETLEAIKKLRLQAILISPNSDMGNSGIIKAINEYKDLPFLQVYKNVPRSDFLGLMSLAYMMVGNSSAGITEAPSLKLLVINIGTRQDGREKPSNVIDVEYDRKEIANAINVPAYNEDMFERARRCVSPYGDGHAGKRIADILSKIEINRKLLEK